MARVNVSGNDRAVIGQSAGGGLNVVFGGVEVFEVRASSLFLARRGLLVLGIVVLILLSVAVALGAGEQQVFLHLRRGVIMSGLAGLYAIWALRHVGVVWRFDHKRKSITRRHWLRGFSRNWKSGDGMALKIHSGKGRFGGETVQLNLVDSGGRTLARVGCWEKENVDLAQVESVVGEIKKVMWWR